MAYIQKGYWCVWNGEGQVREGASAHYPQHRLIYEEHHGVILPRDWVVHHINGDPLDNRVENLEALSRSEHPSRHRTSWRGDQKLCPDCGEWKPIDEFGKGKVRVYCTPCKRERHKRWVQDNPSKVAASHGRRNEKYRQEHPGARVRLTDDQVREIRADDRPARVVAETYGISRWHVYDIRSGRKRADVPA